MTYRQPHNRDPVLVDVPDHPGWYAGNDGHIYRCDGTRIPERPKEAGENRLRVSCASHGGYHYVARLVAGAFLGNRNGMAVTHKDGNPANNRPENLQWVDEAGSNSHCADRRRLNRSQRYEMHRRLDSGEPKTQIAVALGISPRCIRHHSSSCRCNFGAGPSNLS